MASGRCFHPRRSPVKHQEGIKSLFSLCSSPEFLPHPFPHHPPALYTSSQGQRCNEESGSQLRMTRLVTGEREVRHTCSPLSTVSLLRPGHGAVCTSCRIKAHGLCDLTTEIYILTVLEAREKVSAGLISSEASRLGLQVVAFTLCLPLVLSL